MTICEVGFKTKGTMKKDVFQYATRINQSIERFEEMRKTLKEAFDNLCDRKNQNEANELGKLIYELMEKPKGKDVVYAFVTRVMLEMDKTIKNLREEFDAL